MIVPKHLAIIMDGNGRWANLRGYPRIYGHIRGSAQVRTITRECGRLGIRFVTLYAFSSENWGRPNEEVSVLMRLLKKYLIRERPTLMENNVRLKAIGNLENLPPEPLKALQDTMELTKNNTGLTLIFALSYGSRQEILNATQRIGKDIEEKKISVGQINEELLSSYLGTAAFPDPELIIRTSGELRLSNFLLWQAAYSEFYFTEKFWPEFDKTELHVALESYSRRKRRFGLTSVQVTSEVQT